MYYKVLCLFAIIILGMNITSCKKTGVIPIRVQDRLKYKWMSDSTRVSTSYNGGAPNSVSSRSKPGDYIYFFSDYNYETYRADSSVSDTVEYSLIDDDKKILYGVDMDTCRILTLNDYSLTLQFELTYILDNAGNNVHIISTVYGHK